MNRLTTQDRVRILTVLSEGLGISVQHVRRTGRGAWPGRHDGPRLQMVLTRSAVNP